MDRGRAGYQGREIEENVEKLELEVVLSTTCYRSFVLLSRNPSALPLA